MGGCPNCGANLRYTNSYLSTAKGSLNGYGFSRAVCIGTIEREGWSTTKTGERKWRKKYSKEPCGWSQGLKVKPRPKSNTTLRLGALARGETPVAEEAHIPEPTGRLVLNDYRSGF